MNSNEKGVSRLSYAAKIARQIIIPSTGKGSLRFPINPRPSPVTSGRDVTERTAVNIGQNFFKSDLTGTRACKAIEREKDKRQAFRPSNRQRRRAQRHWQTFNKCKG